MRISPEARRLRDAGPRHERRLRREMRRFVPGAYPWQMALLISSLRKENYRDVYTWKP